VIEPLERRRLFSGGTDDIPAAPLLSPAAVSVAADGADVTPPTVIGVRILGTPRETTGVVVTFGESLDAVQAQRVGAYRISREHSGDDSGFFSTPFDDDSTGGQQSIKLDAANYDDATHTVTLVPHETFKGQKRFRRLRINADVGTGVTDVAGNLLDGDEDGQAGGRAFYKLRFNEGRSVSYQEADGDRVKLRVTGPGTVSVLRRLDDHKRMIGGAAQAILSDDTSSSTVLSGTVKRGHGGDGIATIDVISNAGTATIDIAQDPAFAIGTIDS
jgi:hypothetical protein